MRLRRLDLKSNKLIYTPRQDYTDLVVFRDSDENNIMVIDSVNNAVSGTFKGDWQGDFPIDGDITVTGTITAQEFHTEIVSGSIIFTSGSTIFGDSADDTHQFTGSLYITDNVDVQGTISGSSISGSFYGDGSQLTNVVSSSYALSSSMSDNSVSSSYALSGSHSLSSNIANDLVSGAQINISTIDATTITGTTISGSTISGSFVGDGSGLTNVGVSDTLTDGKNIVDFSYTGASPATVALEDDISIENLTISSSVFNKVVISDSGSVNFGNDVSDLHSITGSVKFLNSIEFDTASGQSATFTGLLTADRITGSLSGSDLMENTNIDLGPLGQVTASTFSGSFVGDGNDLTGITASAAPAGPDQSIQFRDGVATSGSSDFTFDKSTGHLTVVAVTGSFNGSIDSVSVKPFSSSVAQEIDSLQTDSGSFSTRITTEEANIDALQQDSGSFSTRMTTEEQNVDALQTDSGSFENRITLNEASASIVTASLDAVSSSIEQRMTTEEGNVDALQQDSGSFSTRVTDNEATASSLINDYSTVQSLGTGDSPTFSNMTIEGDLTAQKYIVSSSVTYMTQSFSSGSTMFGDSSEDTHEFTGSLTVQGNISGSGDLFVHKTGEVSHSMLFKSNTGQFILNGSGSSNDMGYFTFDNGATQNATFTVVSHPNTVAASTSSAMFRIHDENSFTGEISFLRSKGTANSPTTVTSFSRAMQLNSYGYNGTYYYPMGTLEVVGDTTDIGPGSVKSYFALKLADSGSGNTLVAKLVARGAGIGIGDDHFSPTEKLDVDGNQTTSGTIYAGGDITSAAIITGNTLVGDGAGVTGVISSSVSLRSDVADSTVGTLSDGTGISTFTFNGNAGATVAVDGTVVRTGTEFTGVSGSFSGSYDGHTGTLGLSGSFSGSYEGNGSKITDVVSSSFADTSISSSYAGTSQTTNIAISASSNTLIGYKETISGQIESPTMGKSYILVRSGSVSREIKSSTMHIDSGDVTGSFKINTTTLGGGAHYMSGSDQLTSVTHLSASTFTDETLTLLVTGSADIDDLDWTLVLERV